MAININFNGASIRKPGSYSKTSVNLTGGFPLAPAGTVAIVGEADKGMPGSADDIRQNFFSPEQFADVVAKYSSGPIVDAFRLLVVHSSDARIVNGAQRVYIYKTNISTVASGTLATAYGAITSKNYGRDENTISFQTTLAQAEAGPAIASFSLMVDENVTASSLKVRVNGKHSDTVAIPAATTPAAFITAFNSAVGADLVASGGTNRAILTAGNTGATKTIGLTASVNGSVITLALANTTWAVTPTINDTLYIPAGSILANTATNVGGYLITAASTTGLTALKLSDTTTAAVTVAPTLITGATDVYAFSPITLTYGATTPAGVGAAVELIDGGAAKAFGDLIYGGSDRSILSSTQVTNGSQLKFTKVGTALDAVIQIDTAFAAMPSVGDLLVIRGDSVIAGTLANIGTYQVTAATTNTISVTKFFGVANSLVTVAYTDILATTDVEAFLGILSTSAIPNIITSVSEPQVTITANRQSDGTTETSVALGGTIALKMGYDGDDTSVATVSISSTKLTTAVTLGSGANLSMTLADYNTIQEMVDYINSQTGYTAAAGSNVLAGYPPSILDQVSAVGICSTNSDSMPGRIKKDSYEVQGFFDNTILVDLSRTIFVGLPVVMSSALFLAGGAKGGTTAASVVAGIDELQKVRINTLVPLFSRDASYDILDELTEVSSSYQISAINAAAKSHVLLMSDTKHRSERNAFCSYSGAYAAAKTESTTLANERVSLCIQDVKVLKTDGTLGWVAPWGLGCVAAGMQAGAQIGEPMTFKFVNISGVRSTGFDPTTQFDDGIDNGLLFVEQPSQGGFRIVVGNTTYGKDANFVYNRISVLYAADSVAYNLRSQLESIFVGVGLANASAASIKNTTISILNTFRSAGLIVGDDTNGGSGFKNLLVRVNGNVVSIDVTITPVQGIDFILPSIVLDTIQQTA